MSTKSPSFWYDLDIFGLSIPLRYKQRSEYQTKCGLLSSIILFLGLVLLILIFGIQLLKRSNFSIISSLETNVTSTVDLSQVPIIFGLQNTKGEIIEEDPSLFTLSAVFVNFTLVIKDGKNELVNTVREIEMEKCDINRHFYGFHSYFSHLNISAYMCFKPGQNLLISGRIGDKLNGFKQLYVYVNKCNSSTIQCQNETVVNSKLSNGFFIFNYLSNTVDHFNYSYPIQKEVRSESFSISTSLFKKYYYKFSQSQYDSDNGLIFESITPYTFFEYQGYYVDVNFDGNNLSGENSYCFTSFHCHDYVSKYKRICTKVQSVIATISGIINVAFFVLRVLTLMISNKILQIDMVNTLVYDNKTKKEKELTTLQNSSSLNMKSISINTPCNTPLESTEKQINNYLKKRNPSLLKTEATTKSSKINNTFLDTVTNSPQNRKIKYELKVSWWRYIFPFNCYKGDEFSNIKILTNMIYYYLSIEQILPSIEKNFVSEHNKRFFVWKQQFFVSNIKLGKLKYPKMDSEESK